jgi:hypothetical protein
MDPAAPVVGRLLEEMAPSIWGYLVVQWAPANFLSPYEKLTRVQPLRHNLASGIKVANAKLVTSMKGEPLDARKLVGD